MWPRLPGAAPVEDREREFSEPTESARCSALKLRGLCATFCGAAHLVVSAHPPPISSKRQPLGMFKGFRGCTLALPFCCGWESLLRVTV